MTAFVASLVAITPAVTSPALAALSQAAEGISPLPAEPPIGGAVWTVVIPAILLVGSFLATLLLYRRFAREEGAG